MGKTQDNHLDFMLSPFMYYKILEILITIELVNANINRISISFLF